MMKVILASATLLAFSAAPALAQVTSQPPADGAAAAKPAHEDKFAMHDGDKNGTLSLAEVQKADSTVTQADFDKYDADKSKSLSKAEFMKWAEAKHSAPASAPGQ